MINKNLPLYDLVLEDDTEGVSKISLVDSPAIEQDFIMFSKDEPVQIILSQEKQIITTPVLIANQKIYRNNQQLGEHYVRFNKKTIELIVQKYFKDGNQLNFNLEHSQDVNGLYMFESYLVNKSRGINPPIEFSNISDGSWIASFKIENNKLWEAVKLGQFKGVSVECLMSYKQSTQMDSERLEFELIYKELCKINKNNIK